ncbi:MAG: type I-C CRISPR-associated protein Cas8c/Csd1 [Dehalococcoidia bacterium]|nr:type I-C CRISPR-associated protein Cas8c/Csd1 [Dehalococcoidia bacterium]
MLIQKLVQYAAQTPDLADADPYFEKKPVRWLVVITPMGGFDHLLRLGDERRGREEHVPRKVGANAGGVATFATDNPRFVLGYAEGEDARGKAASDLTAFAALTAAAARAHPEVADFQAAAAFYADAEAVVAARQAAAEAKVKDGDRLALALSSANYVPLFATPAGRSFWREHRQAEDAARRQEDVALCLSCGGALPPVPTGGKLMGVPDGQPSGTSLVSFDKDSFTSYGWEQNKNAAMCVDCSRAFTGALNHLLDRGNGRRITEGGAAFTFWSDVGGGGDDLVQCLNDPEAEHAKVVLTAARTSVLPNQAPDARLYALGLRGNGGRAVVVDWFEQKLAEAYANLAAWFDDLKVNLLFDEVEKGVTWAHAGDHSRDQRLWALCLATVREAKEVSPRTPAALVRAALRGDPLPLAIAEACIRRLPLDGFGDFFAPARVGLIRCTLNRRNPEGRQLMPGLDPDNDDQAYLCGRLFATLEAVQYAGVGDVGASVVDRFYGKASTAPALVFGQLLTLAQSHLGAIPNDGQRVNLDRELSGIVAQLGVSFPRTLTLEEQGRFAIGYYHQKAYRYAEIKRRRDERAAAAASNGNQEDHDNG